MKGSLKSISRNHNNKKMTRFWHFNTNKTLLNRVVIRFGLGGICKLRPNFMKNKHRMEHTFGMNVNGCPSPVALLRHPKVALPPSLWQRQVQGLQWACSYPRDTLVYYNLCLLQSPFYDMWNSSCLLLYGSDMCRDSNDPDWSTLMF